jgi:hypothetical protein
MLWTRFFGSKIVFAFETHQSGDYHTNQMAFLECATEVLEIEEMRDWTSKVWSRTHCSSKVYEYQTKSVSDYYSAILEGIFGS